MNKRSGLRSRLSIICRLTMGMAMVTATAMATEAPRITKHTRLFWGESPWIAQDQAFRRNCQTFRDRSRWLVQEKWAIIGTIGSGRPIFWRSIRHFIICTNCGGIMISWPQYLQHSAWYLPLFSTSMAFISIGICSIRRRAPTLAITYDTVTRAAFSCLPRQ